ncbi:hypothetical protein C8R42DRAFT_7818 [Lentinula raphanica]|nr:hypothetical protein C8R42DRAFT_7818 [Lentinula raphanica]
MMRRFWLSSTIWLLVYYTHIGPRPDSAWLDSPLSSCLLLLFLPPPPLMRSDGMNHLMIGIDSLWPAWPCQLSNCLQITMLKASSPDIVVHLFVSNDNSCTPNFPIDRIAKLGSAGVELCQCDEARPTLHLQNYRLLLPRGQAGTSHKLPQIFDQQYGYGAGFSSMIGNMPIIPFRFQWFPPVSSQISMLIVDRCGINRVSPMRDAE